MSVFQIRRDDRDDIGITKFFNKFIQTYCIPLIIYRSFTLQNNPKNVDLSYKMDLEFRDCYAGKISLLQNFIGLI